MRDDIDRMLYPEPVGYEVELYGRTYKGFLVYRYSDGDEMTNALYSATSRTMPGITRKLRKKLSEARDRWIEETSGSNRSRVIVIPPTRGPKGRAGSSS